MALSEQEVETAYSALSDATRECKLHWVLEQVEERIAFGKTTLTKVKATPPSNASWTEQLEPTYDGRQKRGAKTTFVVADPYSPAERLALLVDALLMAVPIAHAVASDTVTGMQNFGVRSLMFSPDLPSSESRELRSDDINSYKRDVLLLDKLLKELKAEIEDVP